MKNKTNESGRSMVEMLGVLAIIGVLSVGGIAGYTSAMNKHRANETIDRLMKRAIIVSGQRLLGQEGSLSGFNTNDGTYAITLNDGASGTATTFTMTATNVPQVVCERIKALEWPATNITSGECAEGENTMTFLFNNDLSDNPAAPTPKIACKDINVTQCGTLARDSIQICKENGCIYWNMIGAECGCATNQEEANTLSPYGGCEWFTNDTLDVILDCTD